MATSRQLRCEPQKWEVDQNKKSDVLKFKDGMIRNNVFVLNNVLSFVCKRRDGFGCYPDDMLAIIRDVLMSYNSDEKHTQNAILKIQEAINELDQRAVEIHGYSNSEEEKNYVPPYLKK